MINYFKIKILKYLIFPFYAFSLIFLQNAVTKPPKYPPATFCYAGSYQKEYDFDKIECLGVLKNHMAIAPKNAPHPPISACFSQRPLAQALFTSKMSNHTKSQVNKNIDFA